MLHLIKEDQDKNREKNMSFPCYKYSKKADFKFSVLRKLFAAKKRSKSSLTTMDIFYFNMVLGMLSRNFSRLS